MRRRDGGEVLSVAAGRAFSVASVRVMVRYTTVARMAPRKKMLGGPTPIPRPPSLTGSHPVAQIRAKRAGEDVCQPEGKDRVASHAPANDDCREKAAGRRTDTPGLQPVSSRIPSPAAVPRANVTRMASQ
jgi:hypothetical protein